MLVHFFSAEGWQSCGLDGEPLIPERMPVLFDDDFLFEDEGGPRATRAVNAWLRTLPSSGAPSPTSWRAYALAARDWLMHLRRHRVSVFGTRQELVAALGTYPDRRLSGPLDERLEFSSWELQVTALSRFYDWAEGEGLAAARRADRGADPVGGPGAGGQGAEVPHDVDRLRLAGGGARLHRPGQGDVARVVAAGEAAGGGGGGLHGGRVNGWRTRWAALRPEERLRLVGPEGGSLLLALSYDGRPFVDWGTPFRRTARRIRERFEPRFPDVAPHRCRHTFAMATLEKLAEGHYRQAAQLAAATGDASGLALYLLKADPLLILRDPLGHSSVVTTEVYLKRLDVHRIYRAAWERTRAVIDAAAFAEADAEFAEEV
ncbi:hypothetical protein ACIF8T_24890 [Streptomyces sp. NPDC085946]|uniref:hypothetical protein n=1 Tax=Streptomyces sp. NPDC085946 TaxID=3365744 RepID=UPI0037D921A3